MALALRRHVPFSVYNFATVQMSAARVEAPSPGAWPARQSGDRAERRILWTALLLGSLLSLAVSWGIATRSIVIGSEKGHWVYGFIQPVTWQTAVMFLLVAVLAAALLGLSNGRTRREGLLVCGWLLAGLAMQALLRFTAPFAFERIFISDAANSFYSVTLRYDPGSVLRDFHRLRADWPLHAQSNLPGKLMLVYALEHVSRRPAVLAWLVVVLSNLGGVFLYVFVRDLVADRRAAFFSLVLYLFVPARLFFLPLLNTVTPVVVLACTWLLLRWLMTGGGVYAALFGAALYGLVFYEPLPLVMGLLWAALAYRALRPGDIWTRTFLLQSGNAIVAFALTYVAVFALTGFDLIDALWQTGASAAAFNAIAARPYATWVRQNLLDFAFGTGVCQAVCFCGVLGAGIQRPADRSRTATQPIATLSLALAGVLLALDLIGINRGEVVRLWIFLACFFQIPAAYVCARLNSRPAIALVLGTTLLQDALGISTIGFVVP